MAGLPSITISVGRGFSRAEFPSRLGNHRCASGGFRLLGCFDLIPGNHKPNGVRAASSAFRENGRAAVGHRLRRVWSRWRFRQRPFSFPPLDFTRGGFAIHSRSPRWCCKNLIFVFSFKGDRGETSSKTQGQQADACGWSPHRHTDQARQFLEYPSKVF